MRFQKDFRSRVLSREWLAGTFLTLGSPTTAEIAGLTGFDWAVLDHEHGAGGDATLLAELQALGNTPTVPIVRIPSHDPALFKRALDLGAQGVMVPYVETADQARAMVSAMRYPPRGTRGVATSHRAADYSKSFAEYYAHAHEWLVGVAQIETPRAIENAEAIAAVEGVDVLFVGPFDLSYNLGIPEGFERPEFLGAIERVALAARAHGKAAGILVRDASLIEGYRRLGFSMPTFGSDGGSVRSGLQKALAALKPAR